jgi:hypothetical protein
MMTSMKAGFFTIAGLAVAILRRISESASKKGTREPSLAPKQKARQEYSTQAGL